MSTLTTRLIFEWGDRNRSKRFPRIYSIVNQRIYTIFIHGDFRRYIETRQGFPRKIVEENKQIIDEQDPERKQKVVEILKRIEPTGRRRGGPTKELLLQLRDKFPEEVQVSPTLTKLQGFVGIFADSSRKYSRK